MASLCFQRKQNFFHPGDDGGLRFDDPEIGIVWPDSVKPEELNINDRDRNWADFSVFKAERGIQ